MQKNSTPQSSKLSRNVQNRFKAYTLTNKGLKQKRQESAYLRKATWSTLASLATISFFPADLKAQTLCVGPTPMTVAGTRNGDPTMQVDLDADGMVDFTFVYDATFRAMNPANLPVYTNVLENAGNMPRNSGDFPLTAANQFNSTYIVFGGSRDVFVVLQLTGGSYGFLTIRGDAAATNMITNWGSGAATKSDVVFSSSYQTCPNAPLPVELTSFTVKPTKESIQLHWQTVSEESNAGFEVQRSEDGKIFKTLTFVEGYGTTIETQDYSYSDKALHNGQTYYYRLKQIDFGGTFEYSKVVSVHFGGKNPVATLTPNPVQQGFTQVTYTASEAGELSLHVFDASGKVILGRKESVTEGVNMLDLNLDALAEGMYFVKMQQGTHQLYEKVIVK